MVPGDRLTTGRRRLRHGTTEEESVVQIKQDTAKVHLLDDDKALCGITYPEHTVRLRDWAGGFTPASLGTRVCRDCEEKAGTAARFEPGEGARPSGFTPIDQT